MIKQKILKNISWLFFDNIVRIFGGLLVGIWVARYLGPNDFGILNYSLAYTALYMFFVKLGLDQIIIREIVKKPKLTNYMMGTAFGLKFIGSIITLFLIYLSLYFLETDSITKIVIFIISVGFILQSIDVIDFFYQSKVLSKYVVIARNTAFILSSLLKIYFILNEYSVLYFAVANVFDLFLSGLFLIFIYKKTGYAINKWRFSTKKAIELLKFSWPLALSFFLISIYTKIDQVMIGNMLDTEKVGIYSVAVRLSEVWLLIPNIMISTMMPYFVSLREENNQLYHERLVLLYSFMFWLGVFVGIVTIIFGEDIILFLFGQVYLGAYEALIYNIWSGIFISQAVARGIWLISENLQKYRLYNNVMAVVLNIFMNFILIPKYGVAGAALATLCTQALSTWLFSFLWKPMRKSTLEMIKSINPVYLYNIIGKLL
ncbi:flippase [Sulfurimonas microaerophilic]|uniref:flippase n=1 Tax=Sulfurimonas microaerophilic TaxID=3058392 RepID=UPI0027150B55|nr:flippase [Sulfurimonas sp. hsl 1-7]